MTKFIASSILKASMKFEQSPSLSPENSFYQRALEKVNSYIKEIDPDLRSEIASFTITPNDPSAEKYTTFALKFFSVSKPKLNWTMEIEQNDNYINNRLENIIKKIYKEQLTQ
ncbi:hypothetical protein F9K33_10375 [bacterium]|nr:MAG: hypothetical protein F9K33_10375 [bacterium]